MTIQKLIEKALKRLEREGKLLTPDYYAQAFCLEAQLSSTSVEDCMHLEKFKQTLNKEFQKELEHYRVKTVPELVRFLISRLNRTNPANNVALLEAETELTKKVLQAITLMHNKEATELAKKTIEVLESHPALTQIEHAKQLWINFFSQYDDTFLQKLSPLTQVDRSDLKTTLLAIQEGVKGGAITDEKIGKIASLLAASFVPSIASAMDAAVVELGKKIENNPKMLGESGVEEEIKTAIALRIALDKESLGAMIQSLDGVVAKLSSSLLEMIEKSDSSTVEIQKIKQELDGYETQSASDFKMAHTKLFKIAVALEENTKLLNQDLKHHSTQVKVMGEKIRTLEEELKKAREESKEDFLTKLYNKRALHEFFKIRESSYERFGHNYSVVFFDLDHFKKINDIYGHEAGDAVLSAFGKILKKECRVIDVVGRYGGEEFVAILNDTDKSGAAVFAEKVRAHVEKTRFMFRGQRIALTVSSGVSERDENTSLKNLIDLADKRVYQAKANGRNCIVS